MRLRVGFRPLSRTFAFRRRAGPGREPPGFFLDPSSHPSVGPSRGPSATSTVLGMSTCPAAIQALVDHVETRSDLRSGRRRAAEWAAVEPDLTGFPSPAAVAAAIRTAGPTEQDRLVCALLRRAASDDLAQLTVVAGLSRRLGWIVAGWKRAGVPPADLPILEADLVSECWAAVAVTARTMAGGDDPPPRPTPAIVQTAWEQVRGPRRRQLRHAARQETSTPDRPAPAPTVPAGEQLAEVVVSAVRSGRLSLTGARLVYATRVAGWSVIETAERLDCSPQSVRTRRARAEHRLAAA